jgi:hypothetical protein
MQKEGVFACDYAKTPQKESKKVIFLLLVLIILITFDQFINTYRLYFLL